MPDFMEENKEDVKKTESSPDSVAVELKRVRSSNKIFKIAAIVSATLFVLLLGVVIFVYQKLAGLRDLLMPPTETYQDSGFRAGGEGNSGELPPAFRGLLSSTRAAGGAALSVAKLNGSVVDSSLTVFTNAGEYSQGAGGITMEDSEKMTRVIARYADRPIVKDFMEELKKDPSFVKAMKQKDANNPVAMIAALQRSSNMEGLAAKFVMRRDFMPFMTEVLGDPDLQPLLKKMPMGNMGPMSQMLKMMPAAPQPGVRIPQRAPPAHQPEEYAAPDEGAEEPDEPVRKAAPAGTVLKKVAPPAD